MDKFLIQKAQETKHKDSNNYDDTETISTKKSQTLTDSMTTNI